MMNPGSPTTGESFAGVSERLAIGDDIGSKLRNVDGTNGEDENDGIYNSTKGV